MSVEDTFVIDQVSHPDWGKPRPVRLHSETVGPYAVLMSTKCRKCDTCLSERAEEWAARARFELGAASRTWFGTLTLSPFQHEQFANMARKANPGFDEMTQGEQFTARHDLISAELTKIFKRMRKAGICFRYMLVVEPHGGKRGVTEQTGLPHYHVLIHEIGSPIRKRELETYWNYGHSQWRLVDDEKSKAAWYVAKYLAKTSVARVRASVRYGGGLGG